MNIKDYLFQNKKLWIICLMLALSAFYFDKIMCDGVLFKKIEEDVFTLYITLYSVFIAVFMISSPTISTGLASVIKNGEEEDRKEVFGILDNIRAAIYEGAVFFAVLCMGILLYNCKYLLCINDFFAVLICFSLFGLIYMMFDSVKLMNTFGKIILYTIHSSKLK